MKGIESTELSSKAKTQNRIPVRLGLVLLDLCLDFAPVLLAEVPAVGLAETLSMRTVGWTRTRALPDATARLRLLLTRLSGA